MPNCGFSRTAAVDHRSVLDCCQQQCLTQTTTVRNVSGHTSHVQEEECFVLPVPHSVWCTHTHGLNFSTFAMLSLLPSSVGERQTRGEEQVQQVIKTESATEGEIIKDKNCFPLSSLTRLGERMKPLRHPLTRLARLSCLWLYLWVTSCPVRPLVN